MWRGLLLAAVCGTAIQTAVAQEQVVKANVRTGPPEWSRGIAPINRDSYYSAIECGKQKGQNPPCVFWDTGVCKNEDFELTFYTAYKMVAYAVWDAVHQNRPAPTPDYAEAQRTRVTIAVKPLRPKDNPVVDMSVKRNDKTFQPLARAPMVADTRFTFDYPVWAATTDVTLQIAGKTRPLVCTIEQAELAQMR